LEKKRQEMQESRYRPSEQGRRDHDRDHDRDRDRHRDNGNTHSSSSRSSAKMKTKTTAAEREAALREMEADASTRNDHLSKSKRVSNATLYEEEIQRRQEVRAASSNGDGGGNGKEGNGHHDKQASFVHDISLKAHGIENQSILSDRVSQHRGRQQRQEDSFL